MIESMCGGEFLCKNVNEAWDFLENLSDKTYEWEPIRKFHSITSKIFMNKEGKSSNNFVALEDTTRLVSMNLKFLFFILLKLMITFIPLVLMIFF